MTDAGHQCLGSRMASCVVIGDCQSASIFHAVAFVACMVAPGRNGQAADACRQICDGSRDGSQVASGGQTWINTRYSRTRGEAVHALRPCAMSVAGQGLPQAPPGAAPLVAATTGFG
ncbi:hypothetical protein D8B29_23310, partial [Verminephrobacter eiseniae]|nr:hypothetical protein [Verminephrobacter eiseniae]